jgi:hypothetical protein
MHYSIDDNFPLYSGFILILVIISALYLETFPCKFIRVIKENIYLKHFIGFLTMIFFVVLTSPIKNKKIFNVIKKSFIMYIIFIFLIKTNYHFFIAILILLGILYISMLNKYDLIDEMNNENDKTKKEELDNKINTIIVINNTIFIIVIILIIVGFLIYMGQKKIEYKDKFNYLTFIFGKIECKNTNVDKEISLLKGLTSSFN